MTKDDVRKVIGLLLSDDNFRESFSTNKDLALEAFTLSDTEIDAIRSIDLDMIDSTDLGIARDLELAGVRVHSVTIT
ncbi:MAG: hypothetical protein NXH97_22370 [Rhodobacteraceae bacterium]|nr:hypothetical protein [Paracoccaceae bacterium]